MAEAKIIFKKVHDDAKIPAYQSEEAAGFDLHCTETMTLEAGKVSLVPTGLAMQLSKGYELQVRARSGLAAKKGVFLVNGIGTIDSDYRGEIKVILSTCSNEKVTLEKGERVAQAVISKVERAQILEAETINATERGAGGFGSTGTA